MKSATKRVLVLSLAVFGLAAAGCSTNTASEQSSSVKVDEGSYGEYANCIANLPIGWPNEYCDGVKSSKNSSALSFQEFSAGATVTPVEDIREAYKSYLSTLDSETQIELSTQWRERAVATEGL